MFQDIFLYISVPTTISCMCVIFQKNYWEMAGIFWVILSLLNVIKINLFIGILCTIIGIIQIIYGLYLEYENKVIKENIKLWFNRQFPLS
jgi:lipid-A-disaccharide synthase-like uncharacterized protein